jgi:hypothetical protein
MKRNIKMTKPQRPADLDNTKLHSREEYRAWQDATYEFHAAVRAEEQRAATKAAAEAAQANRVLTPDDYWALAVEREAIKQARQAELQAAEQAKLDAAAEYLASQPDVAVIDATNPYGFLKQVTHWANLGYVLPDDADITMLPTFCAVKLNKPAPAAKRK